MAAVFRSLSICDPTGASWSDASLIAALTLFGLQWTLAGVAKTPHMASYVQRLGFLHITLYWFLGALLQEALRVPRPRADVCAAGTGLWNRALNVWGFPDILYVSPGAMSLALLWIDAAVTRAVWTWACTRNNDHAPWPWWRRSGYLAERWLDWFFWSVASVAYWTIEFLLDRTNLGLAIANWIATIALAALSFVAWYAAQYHRLGPLADDDAVARLYAPHHSDIRGVRVERTLRTIERSASARLSPSGLAHLFDP